MGLFDDAGIDADEIEVASSAPLGTWPATITGAETKKSKAGDPYLVFSYTMPNFEFPIQDWFRLVPPGESISTMDDVTVFMPAAGRMPAQTRKAFFANAYKQLKRRLVNFGVPEDKVNSVNPEELIGQPIMITLVANPKSDFPKIAKVTTPGASGVSIPTAVPSVIPPSVIATQANIQPAAAAVPSFAVNPFAPKP